MDSEDQQSQRAKYEHQQLFSNLLRNVKGHVSHIPPISRWGPPREPSPWLMMCHMPITANTWFTCKKDTIKHITR